MNIMKNIHFDLCIDENCERKWCVDRRNALCKDMDCELNDSDRCKFCHVKFFCTCNEGGSWCDIHGDGG